MIPDVPPIAWLVVGQASTPALYWLSSQVAASVDATRTAIDSSEEATDEATA